jgi:hypothetical protein
MKCRDFRHAAVACCAAATCITNLIITFLPFAVAFNVTDNFTTGDSDFLLISETNDAENIIAALMAAAAAGTVSDVTTARAWTGGEFKAIADKASKAQKAYRVPGKK